MTFSSSFPPQLGRTEGEVALPPQKVKSHLHASTQSVRACREKRVWRVSSLLSVQSDKRREGEGRAEDHSSESVREGNQHFCSCKLSLMFEWPASIFMCHFLQCRVREVLLMPCLICECVLCVYPPWLDQDAPCQQLWFSQWGGPTGPAAVQHHSEWRRIIQWISSVRLFKMRMWTPELYCKCTHVYCTVAVRSPCPLSDTVAQIPALLICICQISFNDVNLGICVMLDLPKGIWKRRLQLLSWMCRIIKLQFKENHLMTAAPSLIIL